MEGGGWWWSCGGGWRNLMRENVTVCERSIGGRKVVRMMAL